MTIFYTCTQITLEVYTAYLKYNPSSVFIDFHTMQAVALCTKRGKIVIFPVHPSLNARHLREFGSTDLQGVGRDSNTLVNIEEFFSQLFILELEQ